ncbi:SMODS domain-containing nucleotidyltransferase [Sphingopyxis witflariensis]|uniref:SMODS domain-containing nucleotidyltransferase n=1 Tax=Sphingopyxis witflariensis TaxID=173675 RepID=UPI003AFAAC2F
MHALTALCLGHQRAQQREATISRADDFKTLFSNIAIDNEDTIALRYGEVTRACNLQFRDTDSRTANSLQVGSYVWIGVQKGPR